MRNDWLSFENLKNAATIASALAAWAAFVLSVFNFRIQSRALKLNVDKEQRQASSISFYLKKSSAHSSVNGTIFLAECILTNKSEVGNSIVRSSLVLTYQSNPLVTNTIYINSSGLTGSSHSVENETKIPIKIASRESIDCRFSFFVSNGVLMGKAPSETIMVFEDADGKSSEFGVGF